jgi:hypothetical protein
MIGEELCFRQTTILGSSRPYIPAAHTASLVFLAVALHFQVPLAVTEEAWASAHINKRAFRLCVPGGPVSLLLL